MAIVHESLLQPEKGGKSCSLPGRHIREFLTRILAVVRLPPKAMAKKLVRTLRAQHPDYHYLKKVFQHTRELLAVGPMPRGHRLPELLTEAELVAFYAAIWQAHQLTHVVMLKLGRVCLSCG